MTLPTITIDGRLTQDAELRYTNSGKPVLNMRVAASDSRKTDAGEWETTEQLFVNVALFEGAETVAETAVRGAQVRVTGRLYEREYDRADGTRGKSLELKFPYASIRAPRDNAAPVQAAGAQWATPGPPAADPWATPPAAAPAAPPTWATA